MAQTDVLIVGGGLTGPLTAIALAKAGLAVTVLDALPASARGAQDFDGRAYALAHASTQMLQALGLWDALKDTAQPILDIKVSDGRAGEGASPFFAHFDHAEIEEGPMGHLVEDRHLRPALLDAMDAIGVTHLSERRVTQWSPGQVTAGEKMAAPLILAADGRASALATMAGIRRQGWAYAQTSLVCAIAHERAHDGCAHQFFTPSGPLAILPLKGNRSSIVWTETRARADEISTMDDAGYLAALAPVFGDFLGKITLEGARFSYPLGLSLAQSLTAPRLALVGDAGHGIHPLAGQGFNLGMRDAAALAEVVVEARRRGEDIGTPGVLARYARWRRFDTMMMAAATDGINRLFSNDNPALRAARDLGLGALGALPGLRRAFIRQAAGLTGDRPRLLRGQPL